MDGLALCHIETGPKHRNDEPLTCSSRSVGLDTDILPLL